MRLLNIAVMVAGVGVGLTAAAERPSWYVITGLGHGQKFGMDQAGSNRDTICYPTDACFGAGVGRAVVVVRDVRFRADYRSDSPAQFDPPLSFYNSHQDENLADRTNALLLHVGADYPLTERLSLGARLTYSYIGDIADRGFYIRHPMEEQVSAACPHFVLVPPCFTNENKFDAANGLQLSATVRYRFRRR